MHLKELKKKTPAELVEMAEELGVEVGHHIGEWQQVGDLVHGGGNPANMRSLRRRAV